MLELPSTKMLLSQQAKLISLNSDSAEIAISEKWITMIQSRKSLIQDAFYKALGSSRKIILIQEKEKYSQPKSQEKIDVNKLPTAKIKHTKAKVNVDLELKSEPQIKENANSIDIQAKQFADFFNGEIVDLE